MEVAGDAQGLAAALNHAVSDVANALGPFLAGLRHHGRLRLVLNGMGGCSLALGGLMLWALANERHAA